MHLTQIVAISVACLVSFSAASGVVHQRVGQTSHMSHSGAADNNEMFIENKSSPMASQQRRSQIRKRAAKKARASMAKRFDAGGVVFAAESGTNKIMSTTEGAVNNGLQKVKSITEGNVPLNGALVPASKSKGKSDPGSDGKGGEGGQDDGKEEEGKKAEEGKKEEEGKIEDENSDDKDDKAQKGGKKAIAKNRKEAAASPAKRTSSLKSADGQKAVTGVSPSAKIASAHATHHKDKGDSDDDDTDDDDTDDESEGED